jgi:urease accessory protein
VIFDGISPYERSAHQRAEGEVRLEVCRRGEATVLAGLRQAGCLKLRLPRVDPGCWTQAVTINISGGIAAGDHLVNEIVLRPDATLSVAGQAAERFYRALPGAAPARLRGRLVIEAAAALEWLPQESILFDGFALDRALEVELASDAWFLGVESLVFGRAAMGESVRSGWLRDAVRISRGGRLLLQDAIRLEGAIADTLARPAIAAGARAVASLWHVAPEAPAALAPLRAALDAAQAELGAGVEAAASAWNGLLLARILAPDAQRLRRMVLAGLRVLRGGRMLPKLWQC